MTDTPTSNTGGPSSNGGGSDAKIEAAKGAAHDVDQSARRAVGNVSDDAADEARHVLHDARAHVRSEADSLSRRAAETVRDFSGELRSMADSGESSGYLPNMAGDGAQRLERLSQRLDADGIDGVLHDVRSFARQRPGVFLAGCFGAGIVAGRLLHNADRDDLTAAVRSGATSTDGPQDASGNGPAPGAHDELPPPPAGTTSDPTSPIHTGVTTSSPGGRT